MGKARYGHKGVEISEKNIEKNGGRVVWKAVGKGLIKVFCVEIRFYIVFFIFKKILNRNRNEKK